MILRNLADDQEKEVEYYVSLGLDRESAELIVHGEVKTKNKKENKKDGK